MTIKEFIEEHGLEMNATNVPENPGMDGMPGGSWHYLVTISRCKASVVINYSVGSRIIEQQLMALPPRKRSKYKLPTKPWTRNLKHTVLWSEAVKKYTKDYEPSFVDILECLQMDFAGGIDCDFEEWAEDHGYDTDSRKDEEIYNTVKRQLSNFRRVVGGNAFRQFMRIEEES